MSRRILSVVAAAIAAAVVVGSALGGASHGAKVTKIAIAAPEKANDYGWNQQGVDGARAAAAALHLKLEVADGIGYDNTESVLRQLAQAGADLVIAHASGYSTVVPRVAEQTHVPVLGFGDPRNLKPGLVADAEANNYQGSYLAGMLAAMQTKTGTLGIVRSADIPDWYKLSGGFVAGARSVDPQVKFRVAQIGPASFADAAGGKRVAKAVIAGGADIIFGMGDGASFGYLQAVETAKGPNKVWYIDVLGNKSKIDKKGVLLSSVLQDFTAIYKQAIADVNAGTFGKRIYTIDASNGISLLKTRFIPAATWAKLETTRKQIAAGKLKVPVTTNIKQFNKLLNA